MTTTLVRVLIVFALFGTVAAPVSQSSESKPSPASQLIEKQAASLVKTATTAEYHRELAQYFRKEAQRKRQEEKRYEEIAATYRLHPPRVDAVRNLPTADYYQHLADQARNVALAEDQMATLQERLAEATVQAK